MDILFDISAGANGPSQSSLTTTGVERKGRVLCKRCRRLFFHVGGVLWHGFTGSTSTTNVLLEENGVRTLEPGGLVQPALRVEVLGFLDEGLDTDIAVTSDKRHGNARDETRGTDRLLRIVEQAPCLGCFRHDEGSLLPGGGLGVRRDEFGREHHVRSHRSRRWPKAPREYNYARARKKSRYRRRIESCALTTGLLRHFLLRSRYCFFLHCCLLLLRHCLLLRGRLLRYCLPASGGDGRRLFRGRLELGCGRGGGQSQSGGGDEGATRQCRC